MVSTIASRPILLAAMTGVVASVAFAAGMYAERTIQIPNEERRLMKVALEAERLHGITASIDRVLLMSVQYEQLSRVKSLEDVKELQQASRMATKNALMLMDGYIKKLPEQQAVAMRWLQEPRLTEIRKKLELEP